jgi:hypothetical protein
MAAATLKLIRLELYLPRLFGANKVSGQIPAAVRIRFECLCNVAISMDTNVGLNVATRVCDVYPDNVGLLCCVGSGSNVAVPVDRAATGTVNYVLYLL